jgi:lactococcin 972 family bacteriocin
VPYLYRIHSHIRRLWKTSSSNNKQRRALIKKGIIISSILSVGLMASFAGVAMAEVVNASGGVWDRGSNVVNVWSNYTHPTRRHGSTAVAGSRRVYSGNTDAGRTSFASLSKAPWTHGASYYNYV